MVSFANISFAADANRPTEELNAITRALNELEAWFTGAERKRQRLQQELKEKDEQVATVRQKLDQAEAELARTNADLELLEQRRQTLKDQQTEGAARIAEHLAAAYRLGGQDFLKQLLNQESPETFDRMMRYHQYIGRAHMDALAAYRETLEALETNAAALAAARTEADLRRQGLLQQVNALQSARQEQLALLETLAAETEDKTVERERLEADRSRLQKLIAELRRKATELDGGVFAQRRGTLPWPVRGAIRTRFGQPRAGGRMRWHGVNFTADQGTPVSAVSRGKVVFSDWLRGYGLLAIVDHGDGFLSLYGQAEVLLKNVGDWVEGGETIARAGRSGGQPDAGLYFEIRHDGKVQDPLSWLEKH